MLNKLGTVWKLLPPWLRLRIVRATQSKFTVSAAAIITNERQQVLLLNHTFRPFSGWGLPGGFITIREQPEAAIRREIREETGIELDELAMFRIQTIGRHVEILFTATANGDPEVKSPREIIELGWFEVDRLPAGLSKSQAKVIREVVGASQNGER
ncbi:MAG TPA: NUDIX hydrolase [Pyrinomonadaceae bacterium]|nr:NUDIX hydrolase [Pyrinomonadaceae bacterium]